MVMNNSKMTDTKYTCEEAPCVMACPIRQDARDYVQLIARGLFKEAYRLVRERNVLPSSCGRICTHPCETKCRRNSTDAPIAIAWLKRFLSDNYSEKIYTKPGRNYPEKIAIIGAGPAGLAAANDLALMGYSCTIFESNSTPGGMLRMGVPTYRLPRNAIDKDVALIQQLGVEIKYNTTLGKDVTLDGLKKEGYAAIFISVGLFDSRNLTLEGIQYDGVLKGIDFLREVNSAGTAKIGKNILVIGGGAVAMDCARTALRLKPEKVSVACLEARKEMPTTDFEIEETLHEGIKLYNSVGPKRILGKGGMVTGLETLRVKYVFDEQKRFNPAFYEGSESIIEADTIILAIGQTSNLSFLKNQEGLQISRGGTIIADPNTFATSVPGIYAGGDIVLGRGTLTECLAQGKKAAISIHNSLRNEKRKDEKWADKPEVQKMADSRVPLVKKEQKQDMPMLSLGERLNSFDEVELGFSHEIAVREAQRCMNCGAGAFVDENICIGCITCVRVCPFDVPEFRKGETTAYIGGDCQSCGLCIVECPAKAISFKTPLEDRGRERLKTLFAEKSIKNTKPLIVNFYCQYGSLSGNTKSNAVVEKHVKRIGILGLGKVDPSLYLNALEWGADGVLITACKEDGCHFCAEYDWIKKRSEYVGKILKELGMDSRIFQTHFISSQTDTAFLDIATQMVKDVESVISVNKS
ncbi:MAG: hydrogenase iron-sulfur subunit [Planctomycetes bacterium]|nr:hydrogenase iron-sulfur subunit [Planctomycetota bacterium]